MGWGSRHIEQLVSTTVAEMLARVLGIASKWFTLLRYWLGIRLLGFYTCRATLIHTALDECRSGFLHTKQHWPTLQRLGFHRIPMHTQHLIYSSWVSTGILCILCNSDLHYSGWVLTRGSTNSSFDLHYSGWALNRSLYTSSNCSTVAEFQHGLR